MWVEIFKTGEHTDSNGNTAVWSEESLDNIAYQYNDTIAKDPTNEAPVVKGHPQTNDPAYGWVERLARRGNKLLAKLKGLQEDFVEEVRSGKYKRISMALYPDMMLRHIGFLGAAAPAVKGLQTVKFTEAEKFETMESEYCAKEDNSTVKSKNNSDNDCRNCGLLSEYQQRLDSLFNENKELKRELEYSAQISEQMAKEARLKEFREYANSLVSSPDGTFITPAQAEKLVDLLEMAFRADRAFSAEDDECSRSGVELVKEFVSALKPQFAINEFAAGSRFRNIGVEDSFEGRKVSQKRLELHKRVIEIQKENPGLSYEEAACMAGSW